MSWFPCCCNGSGGGGGYEGPTIACAGYDAIAAQWEVVIAGVTNGTCTNCTISNGTWILSDTLSGTPSLCAFAISPGFSSPMCGFFGGGTALALTIEVGGFAILQTTGVSTSNVPLRWRIDYASFDPLGPNVLTDFHAGTECQTQPSTVTITPYP